MQAFSYNDWSKLADLLALAPPGCGKNTIFTQNFIGKTAKHNLHHTRKQADEADMDFNFISYHLVWNDIEDVTDLSRGELKK